MTYVQNRTKQNRTCVMLCYMTYVKLYNMCHVIYNICHVMFYNMCHVMLYNIYHVMLYDMCHVMLYNICHVILCYITYVMLCNDFPQITKEKGCEFCIPDSRSHAFHKPYKNMADSK